MLSPTRGTAEPRHLTVTPVLSRLLALYLFLTRSPSLSLLSLRPIKKPRFSLSRYSSPSSTPRHALFISIMPQSNPPRLSHAKYTAHSKYSDLTPGDAAKVSVKQLRALVWYHATEGRRGSNFARWVVDPRKWTRPQLCHHATTTLHGHIRIPPKTSDDMEVIMTQYNRTVADNSLVAGVLASVAAVSPAAAADNRRSSRHREHEAADEDDREEGEEAEPDHARSAAQEEGEGEEEEEEQEEGEDKDQDEGDNEAAIDEEPGRSEESDPAASDSDLPVASPPRKKARAQPTKPAVLAATVRTTGATRAAKASTTSKTTTSRTTRPARTTGTVTRMAHCIACTVLIDITERQPAFCHICGNPWGVAPKPPSGDGPGTTATTTPTSWAGARSFTAKPVSTLLPPSHTRQPGLAPLDEKLVTNARTVFDEMPQQHRPFADHPCATAHPALIAQAQTFLALAIGDSTRQTYSTGVRSFISFVDSHGIRPAFPASVQTLCLWVSFLASPPRAVTLGTCKVYLSAVVARHAEMGYDHPLADAPPLLTRVMAGIKRMAAQERGPKLPITTALLEDMRPHMDLQQRSDILLWAMMWTATSGLLRISEFTTQKDSDAARVLTLQQLTFHIPGRGPLSLAEACSADEDVQYAILRLNASKTDPFRAGVDIVLSSPTTLQALLAYGTHLPASGDRTAPLFHDADRSAVSRRWLMKRVDGLLRKTGRNPKQFSSHSFRKGGAVSLQTAGVEDSLIRRVGRWKSDAFHLYVRDPSFTALVDANARL